MLKSHHSERVEAVLPAQASLGKSCVKGASEGKESDKPKREAAKSCLNMIAKEIKTVLERATQQSHQASRRSHVFL
jgi:hypothetical protein